MSLNNEGKSVPGKKRNHPTRPNEPGENGENGENGRPRRAGVTQALVPKENGENGRPCRVACYAKALRIHLWARISVLPTM